MRDLSIVSGGLDLPLSTPFSVRVLRISSVDIAATCLRMDLRALRVFFRDFTDMPMRRSVNRRFFFAPPADAEAFVLVLVLVLMLAALEFVGVADAGVAAVGVARMEGVVGTTGAFPPTETRSFGLSLEGIAWRFTGRIRATELGIGVGGSRVPWVRLRVLICTPPVVATGAGAMDACVLVAVMDGTGT